MPNEDYAIVLDFLAKGKSDSFKSEPIAQVIGTEFFTLLEVVPKGELRIGEKIYVGRDERDKVDYIKRRIRFRELTSTAVSELEKTIERIITENNAKYLNFFNSAGPITIKRHQLELLPGFGKKHMHDLITEREKKPFESFEDLASRVKLVPHPMHCLVKRVMEELEDEGLKHYLFARPPVRERHFGRRG
jgi:putative nucleotide binding protein